MTADFVGTTVYPGKLIHIHVALDPGAPVIGTRFVMHSEPILLVTIPGAAVRDLMLAYIGRDLGAVTGGTTQNLDIISGATVTVRGSMIPSVRRA